MKMLSAMAACVDVLNGRKQERFLVFFLQFLGILAKCYAQNSCLYLLDHKYEKKNSDISSPLMGCVKERMFLK